MEQPTKDSPAAPTPALRSPAGAVRFTPWLIALLVLAAIGFVGYRHWTGTPQYSLWQAQRAAKAHDFTTFEKYVDIQSCVEGLVDDVMLEAVQQAAKTAKSAKSAAGIKDGDDKIAKFGELLGGQFAKGLVAMLKPTLVSLLRQQVRDYIEKGTIEKGDDPSESGLSVHDLDEKAREHGIKFTGLQSVKQDGAIAIVSLGFTSEKEKQAFTIDLKMRRTDNGWQVSRWNNAAEVFKKFAPKPKKPFGV